MIYFPVTSFTGVFCLFTFLDCHRALSILRYFLMRPTMILEVAGLLYIKQINQVFKLLNVDVALI